MTQTSGTPSNDPRASAGHPPVPTQPPPSAPPWAGAQPGGGYPSSLPPVGSPYGERPAAQQSYGAPEPVYQPWGGTPPAPRPQRAPLFADTNPFAAVFDLSFRSFATPGVVKIIYALAIALGVLSWIGSVILGFSAGSSPFVESTSTYGVLNLLFGWIPALMWILLVRVGLELALATVRTAEDVRNLRSQSQQ